MINRIIHFSVYHRWMVLLLTMLVLAAGYWSFRHLPIDAVPDITNVQVQINTPVHGLDPEEVERTITYRIETAMGGLPQVNQVRSMTRFDLSQVTVVFDDNTDIYLARQWVNERLQEVMGDLPAMAKPRLGPVTTGLGEILHYRVDVPTPALGQKRIDQLMDMRALQEFYIKPRLLTVDGVADVGSIGGYQRQFLVQPNPEAMVYFGIHFDDISEALEKINRNVGSGYLQQTAEQFVVQGVGRLEGVEQIKQVPVKLLESLKTIHIGDIAQVREGPDLRMGAALVNGHEAVIGTVMMLIGENSREVSEAAARKIAEIQKELPSGIQLEILYNRSDLVNATLSTVEHNLVYGAILVTVILMLLLGNLRAALITALTIPFSLLMTFLIMKPLGFSGNLMSLGALDFGIIVDGVVIVIDNCVRKLQEAKVRLGRSLDDKEFKDTIVAGAVQVRAAAGFGELIILIAFAPVFAFTGIEGKMFMPMAGTFMIALFSALILSFTTAPALASLFLRGRIAEREPRLMAGLKRIYLPVLNGLLRFPKIAISAAVILIISSVLTFTRLGAEFIPQLDEGSLVLQFLRPAAISLDESIALQQVSEEIIGEFPEVETVFSKVGTADVATDPMPIYLVDTFITFKGFPDDKAFLKKKSQLVDNMVVTLKAQVPGQRVLVTQPIAMRFNELLEGVRSDISLKIFGADLEVLKALSQQAEDSLRELPGVGEVEADLPGKSPLLRIKPREDFLQRLGISPYETLETIAIAIGGKMVGWVYEGIRYFPLVIRLEEEVRSNVEALEEIPVGIFTNKTLPLGELAEFGFEEMFGTILREQGKRRVAVLINAEGRDTAGLVKAAQESLQGSLSLPPGYHMEWGGNFKNLIKARNRLALAAPLVLLLVVLMIYTAFRNYLQTLLILLCVPFSWVGGVLNMLIMDIPFSISAGVGFMALSGISVLNGLVLSNFYNDLKASGVSGLELVRSGALIRLRPVVMTALVEIFGFLPMMLSTGIGAEVQRPLATVVIGGILSSMVLTLLLLPILYRMLEQRVWPTRS